MDLRILRSMTSLSNSTKPVIRFMYIALDIFPEILE